MRGYQHLNIVTQNILNVYDERLESHLTLFIVIFLFELQLLVIVLQHCLLLAPSFVHHKFTRQIAKRYDGWR